MDNKIILICKKVIFYSTIDEDLFFEWIKRISVIVDVKGVLDEIHLYIMDLNLDRAALREIIALFKRYKIDRKQLQIFLNDANEDWLKKFIPGK